MVFGIVHPYIFIHFMEMFFILVYIQVDQLHVNVKCTWVEHQPSKLENTGSRGTCTIDAWTFKVTTMGYILDVPQ